MIGGPSQVRRCAAACCDRQPGGCYMATIIAGLRDADAIMV
jgi:hypothetical protein